jgi:two-component system LytT family response regulator
MKHAAGNQAAGDIRVLVVDDEPLARRGIRDLLSGESDITMVGEAVDGPDAVRAIEALAPDLVFLDVQMPGLDGFQVLERVKAPQLPVVVFVTAHDEHALRAFDVHAVDYLLKPIDPERFRVSLTKARALLGAAGAHDPILRDLLRVRRERAGWATRLLVRAGGAMCVILVGDVDWVEADGDYVRLHAAGKEHLLRETLTSVEGRLDPREFVRIHRSFLTRINLIRRVETEDDGDGFVVLADGTRLAFTRTFRERLLNTLRSSG